MDCLASRGPLAPGSPVLVLGGGALASAEPVPGVRQARRRRGEHAEDRAGLLVDLLCRARQDVAALERQRGPRDDRGRDVWTVLRCWMRVAACCWNAADACWSACTVFWPSCAASCAPSVAASPGMRQGLPG